MRDNRGRFPKGLIPWSKGKKLADCNVSQCSQCGRLINKTKKHVCPTQAWNKGISFMSKEKHPFWGKKLSESHRLHISLARIEGFQKGTIKPVAGMQGKKHKEETKRKLSEFNRGKHDYLLKLTKPTKPERILNELLSKFALGEYKYVGDGQFIINGFNPDFVNIKGKKIAIDVFGDYWHTKKANTIYDTEEARVQLFAQFGWKLIIIWEHEIYKLPPNIIMERITSAMGESLAKRDIEI